MAAREPQASRTTTPEADDRRGLSSVIASPQISIPLVT